MSSPISNSQYGTLITCSVAIKQLILHLNQKTQFVIQDLDDTHVFIQTSYLEYVNSQIDEMLEKNVWNDPNTQAK